MNTKGRLLFLGTGGSMGIPVIGCRCSVCRSESPKNMRLRPSVLLHVDSRNIVIDTGPDYRFQALKYEVDHLDGVIFTHAHFDHTAGIDDLRVYYMHTQDPLPCLLSKDTADDLAMRYNYIFERKASKDKLVARIDLKILENDRGTASFLGMKIGYFSFFQAGMKVNGFRFGNLGFVSDICEYPETIFEDLKGIEILVVSALRFETSRLHFSVDEAIAFSQKLDVKKVWLTHISHEIDHEKVNVYLPSNIQIAYDGLAIDFLSEAI